MLQLYQWVFHVMRCHALVMFFVRRFLPVQQEIVQRRSPPGKHRRSCLLGAESPFFQSCVAAGWVTVVYLRYCVDAYQYALARAWRWAGRDLGNTTPEEPMPWEGSIRARSAIVMAPERLAAGSVTAVKCVSACPLIAVDEAQLRQPWPDFRLTISHW